MSDPTGIQVNIIEQILAEREHQDLQWGGDSHDLPHWMIILMEEVGEAAAAALGEAVLGDKGANFNRIICRAELVQVAAVAMAAIEDIDSK